MSETSYKSSKNVLFFLVNLFSSNLIFEAPEHQNSVNHSKPIQFYVAKLKNGQLAINCVDRNCCKRKRFSMFCHLLLSSTKFVFARIRFIHSFFEIDFYWFVAVINFTFLKVALSQKKLEDFHIAKINIPIHYLEQKI